MERKRERERESERERERERDIYIYIWRELEFSQEDMCIWDMTQSWVYSQESLRSRLGMSRAHLGTCEQPWSKNLQNKDQLNLFSRMLIQQLPKVSRTIREIRNAHGISLVVWFGSEVGLWGCSCRSLSLSVRCVGWAMVPCPRPDGKRYLKKSIEILAIEIGDA